MKKLLCVVAILAALLIGLGPTAVRAQPGAVDVIIMFREGVSHPDREASVRRAGAIPKFNYRSVNGAAAHVPHAAAMQLLQQDPDIVAIIPDRAVHAHVKPGSTTSAAGTGSQVVPAGVQRIGAAPGQTAYTGSGVGVAIVDTGIDFNHGDLKPLNAACFTAFSSCQDNNGHGTHVGGTVAARNNTQDVVGVAPGATLYGVKVLDASGGGTDSTVMAGLDWIAQNAALVSPPIRVVNMSLGRPGTLEDNPLLRASIQNLHDTLGITVVVSAGNDSSDEVSQQVPATYPEVMAIASTTALDGSNAGCRSFRSIIPKDTASYFTTDGAYNTSTGIGVTVSAPGEDKENVTKSCFASPVGILSTKLGGGTTRMSGTSMASPHVAGVVALMWQKALAGGGALSPEDARGKIRTSADRLGIAPLNSPTAGYSFDGAREGIVSAPGALQ